MPEGKAQVEVSVGGSEESSEKLKKVGAAQDGLTKEGAKSTEQAGKQVDAQKKLTAAEGDYIDILRRVNPLLGDLADGLLKGSKVAGDLATQNISLTGVFGKATEAIKANAGALKLVAAGGAVVLGIAAIGKAVAQMKKDWEGATKAVKQYRDAQAELKQEEGDRKASIEQVADTRREGGLTAAEATKAADQAEDIRKHKKYGFLDEGAIVQATGLYGGQGIGDDEMALNAVNYLGGM